MDSQAHKLAWWAGCLLLLLAAGMLVTSRSPAREGLSSQHLRVQLALAGSAPCLTCHSAFAETSAQTIDTRWTHSPLDEPDSGARDIFPQPNTKMQNAHARAEWRALGARLLQIESADVTQVAAAVDQFVAAAEVLDAADSLLSLAAAHGTLGRAGQMVLALEQAANPVQVRPMTVPHTPDTGVNAPLPPAPVAALALLCYLGAVPAAVQGRRAPAEAPRRPERIVCAARRRGPPLGVAALCLLGKGDGVLG